MEFDSLKYFFEHPSDNGFAIFVLGVLFILSVYHFLLYFQNKDKIYLYYSFFTSLIFITHINNIENNFISTLIKPIEVYLDSIDHLLVWVYNTTYFLFAFTFIDIKSYSEKWSKFLYRYVYFLFSFILIFSITYLLTDNIQVIRKGHMLFIFFAFTLGIISYIPVIKTKSPIKHYLIIGSLFLFITSFTSSIIFIFELLPRENETRYTIFYFGVIFENLFFSLGLGVKQKLILQEKNNSQEKLILQLKENESLRNTIQQQLEKEVVLISEKAKNEELEKLKERYDKEFVELKLSSLRSQMNPHFIFNSLNAIKLYIIENEKENAVYYLNKFSKLIRKILATTREKEISLANEIETLKLYIDIENIRFNNEIESSFQIDKTLNINTIKIPSLIFQPFIENAIWHGLSLRKGIKKIKIELEKENNTHLKVSITDNGVGRKKSAEIKEKKIHKKKSIGIKLTEERLINFEKNYKNNYSIDFIDLTDSSKKSLGTSVILRIPLI